MTSSQAAAVIAALQNRNSHPRLTTPAPDDAELEGIFTAGLRAPDHGRLRPWQFLVVEGDARERLGVIFEQALVLANPEASDAERTRARSAPLRAPLIIAGLLKATAHPKIPRQEQVAAVACALHGMLLAAEALGFAGMWRTGSYARDPWVLRELGAAPEDEVIGFLYLGSAEGSPKPIDRPVIADYVRRFTA